MVDNPFRYGDVATGESFTDRSAELDELEADIRNGQNVVIISPRRYGKTSLIFRAIEDLRHERVLVAYLDLFRAPTKDRFADHLAEALYSGLVAPLERVWERAVDVFQKLSIRPKVTVNPDGSPSFEFTAGQRSRDIDRTIEDLLALPGQIATQRRRRVALVLDEFQEVLTVDPRLPGLMRAVFQVQPEVAHVFMGSKRQLMQQVFTHENEPLYKLAKPLSLHPISRDDFAAFIQERFVASGQKITDDAVRRVLATTDGHPHDTQELCYFTWSRAQTERAMATPAVVDRALGQVIEAEDARYTTLWEQLSAHQRLLLTALTQGGEAVYSEAYRREHRLGAASSVQKSLERLIERELVDFTPPASYRVSDAFLRAWIARLIAPDRSRHMATLSVHA
jgi:uncharacterized protein